MFPRYAADLRSILWVCIAAGLLVVQYANPELVPYLMWFSCYFALACGTIAHNHNHCPTFKSRRANRIFGNVLSIFYGYPTFAWIPTHNLNHHKYVNGRGDATITWRYSNKHNFLVASTYFFVSAYFQSDPIKAYIAKAKEKNPREYRRIVSQYVIWGGAAVGMLILAMALHGWKTGLWVWAGALAIPAVFSLWTIMLFNYEQHVHTDPFSKYDHSRSFTGRISNFLLFNNGLHYAHHENPGTHWSKLREVNDRVAHKIHPSLQLRSLWLYWFKQYVVAPFVPSVGTRQLGIGPWNTPDVAEAELSRRDAELGGAGDNEARVQPEPPPPRAAAAF